MSPKATLSNLKQQINKSSSISAHDNGNDNDNTQNTSHTRTHTHTPIQTKYMRLFHLGRELKSGQRSLSALGLGLGGRFSRGKMPIIVHLHSTQPKNVGNGSEVIIHNNGNGNADDNVEEVRYAGQKRTHRSTHAHNSSRTQGENSHAGLMAAHRNQGQMHQHQYQMAPASASRQQEVVELLDSDDDDVEIIETSARGKRTRTG